jgi:hypothetical protein
MEFDFRRTAQRSGNLETQYVIVCIRVLAPLIPDASTPQMRRPSGPCSNPNNLRRNPPRRATGATRLL